MQRLLRRAVPRAAILGLAAAFVVGGTAYAITSGGGSTIKACVSKHSGALYVKAKCGKGYKSISWNKVGRTGATGAKGATGATGSQGAAATITPLTWSPLSLENGWTRYDNNVSPPSFTKDQFGMVHLRGGISGGSTNTVGTLPSGDRPQYDIYATNYGYAGLADESVVIEPDGAIVVWDVGTSASITNASQYTSLENISFSTGS